MMTMTVDYTVRLRFGETSRAAATHTNLSAVRLDGHVLWIAGDETATVERLLADQPEKAADFVDLPGEDVEEEADVEGLARAGHFLWAIGSHSLRRKQIKERHEGQGAL